MHAARALWASLALTTSLGSALAANVTGQVKGPDGKPYMGAFVVAENAKNRMTFSVLSNEQGQYHINNLPAGAYNIQIASIGVKSEPNRNVELGADQKAEYNFTLQTAPVRWSELTTYQGRKLLPKTAEHNLSHQDPYFSTCWQSCHSFQKRIASAVRDEEGWKEKIIYMRDVVMAGEGPRMADKTVDDFAALMAKMFGPESEKPAFASDAPEYKALVRPFSPKAMNIAYVEYDFPATLGMGPWSAVEDKDGMMWIPYYGRGNAVVRLNPETSEFKRFALPFSKTAGVHSAVPADDGKVWFTEAATGKIASLDPRSNEIEEFTMPTLPDGRRNASHTVRVDKGGIVWVSGGPAISMFDPKTRKFQNFDLGGTYGNTAGRNGDQWFTSFRLDGPIGRVADGKLTTFSPPTKGKPQRLEVDRDGLVWFSERQGNKIGRLDPASGEFKEFPLPGPESSPYALGIDNDNMIWYSSHEQDTLGRLDPKTGDVTEYPYPHSEISMREFFKDRRGRMWYASTGNNKVGYFYYND